MADVIELGI